MKAFVLTAVKEPFKAQEIPDPQPGPGQVRVRLHASGVCGTDIHIWNGELPLPLPIVPGHEPAGVIDTIGPGVTSVKVGDRVGTMWIIQDGLKPGERVVAQGQQALRPGTIVQAKPIQAQ